MGQYYYTVSSLPLLDYESEPPFSTGKFLEVCRSGLTEEDFAVIESVTNSSYEKNRFNLKVVNDWNTWESTLRNELVKLRSTDVNSEADQYIRESEYNTEAPAAARNAFKIDSPLEAEEYINRSRWTFLENLEVNHHFDLDKLIVYALKLKIIERKNMFTQEDGENNFQNVYENIIEAVREA